MNGGYAAVSIPSGIESQKGSQTAKQGVAVILILHLRRMRRKRKKKGKWKKKRKVPIKMMSLWCFNINYGLGRSINQLIHRHSSKLESLIISYMIATLVISNVDNNQPFVISMNSLKLNIKVNERHKLKIKTQLI